MKKFEQKLLETGNKELIDLYVEEYGNNLSCEFKEAVKNVTGCVFLNIPKKLENEDAFSFIREKVPQEFCPKFFSVFAMNHIEKIGDLKKLTAADFLDVGGISTVMLAELKYALGMK